MVEQRSLRNNFSGANVDSKRDDIIAACRAMDETRQSFEQHWQDIADFMCPRSYRWLLSDWTSRGNKANKKIIDPTATLSLRAMVAAFSAGITSPSRPWKKLTSTDPAYKANWNVQAWLAECDEIIDEIILKSNFYQEAGKLYEQCGAFGTAVMLIEEDQKDVIRCETLPTGSYYLGCDSARRVNQFYRKLSMTPRMMAKEFGAERCSDRVREAIKDPRRRDNMRVEVWHYVGPNDSYEPTSYDRRDKMFKSCYLEIGTGIDGFLRESGYDEFPLVAPRWKTYADDVYGLDSPAMMSLGHIKSLQHIWKQIHKAAEKQVNPPLQAPESTRRQTIETMPGAVNYADNRGAGDGIRALYQVNFDATGSTAIVNDIRDQIKETFFYNLFLMVANERRSGTKAREIEELHEEKMLMLSTVYEQFSQEFLNPAVSRIFNIANKLGKLPVPPEEFQGQEFTIEYVSVMAQAMKLVGIGNMDRALAVLGQVASARPEALDLLNTDRFTNQYLDRLGVDARIKNSPDEVGAIRQARAAQQQQAQAMQAESMQAETAKTLSETKIEEDNALAQLISQSRGTA